MQSVYRNAKIIAGEALIEGALVVENGRVAAVDPAGAGLGADCEGDFLAPGIIDLHTDNLEKHYFPRVNIDWDPVSAAIVHDGLCASVGVTTVYDSLSVGSYANMARTQDNQARLIEGLGQAYDQGLLRIDHRLHWRCELSAPDLLERLEKFAQEPLTGLLSLMDHTPGQRQYNKLEKHLSLWREEGKSEEEVMAMLANARRRQAENVVPNRRAVAEIARARAIPLAAHDDQTQAHIDDGADAGATISEFPVTRAAAERARARGQAIFMGGPNLIRGGSYSGNVSAKELALAGLLDGFASDYVPRSLIECAVALTREPFGWAWPKAWATISAVPAAALGLADRGVLEPGRRADFIRIRIKEGRALVREVHVEGARVA